MTTENNGTSLLYRVEALERDVKERVPNNEYHLQIQVIKESYTRIEDALSKLTIQFALMQDKLIEQELKAEQRGNEQTKNLAQFQSKIIGWFFTIVGLTIAGYLTWYFTKPH